MDIYPTQKNTFSKTMCDLFDIEYNEEYEFDIKSIIPKIELNQKNLKKILDYNPKTGHLTWKINMNVNGHGKKGERAGNIQNTTKYRRLGIFGKNYKEHRIVWIWYHGNIPTSVDHINRIRDDNRIENLRECTHIENMQNQSIRKGNKSGYIGVCWNSKRMLWRSYIVTNYKQTHLGFYNTKEEAYEAYKNAKKQQHIFNPML